MDDLTGLPSWLGTAVIGAVIAVIGFFGKAAYEWVEEVQERKNLRRARLVELISMLKAEFATYQVQCFNRDRLKTLILMRDEQLKADENSGYDSIFSLAYPNMTEEEKELHTLVRSYTINSIRPLNLAVVEWIKNDKYFKISRKKQGIHGEVSKMLAQLDAHLLMWDAKYKIWIPDSPDHALVYLDDEKKHGIPFPSGIEQKLESLLEKI